MFLTSICGPISQQRYSIYTIHTKCYTATRPWLANFRISLMETKYYAIRKRKISVSLRGSNPPMALGSEKYRSRIYLTAEMGAGQKIVPGKCRRTQILTRYFGSFWRHVRVSRPWNHGVGNTLRTCPSFQVRTN